MKTEYKYFFSGLLLSTLVYSGINGAEIISTAKAESKEKQCVWSYVEDSGAPEIGEVGSIQMDKNWTKMSNGGWTLKAIDEGVYVFEKCN